MQADQAKNPDLPPSDKNNQPRKTPSNKGQ